MKVNTHSLNNYQNCDINSFIHEERVDDRLRLLDTESDASVGSSPWLTIKGYLSSVGEWHSATSVSHRETWSTHLHAWRDRCRSCKGLAGGDAKDEPAAKDPVEDQESPACPQWVVSWSQGMGKNLQRSRVSKIPHTAGNPGPSVWEPSE